MEEWAVDDAGRRGRSCQGQTENMKEEEERKGKVGTVEADRDEGEEVKSALDEEEGAEVELDGQ